MLRLRFPIRLAFAGFMIAMALPAAAGAQAVNLDRAGVALSGYDPVAYQTENTARKGSPEFVAMHEGATYQFTSAANRDAFVADPGRYLPAYGGYCAYGVAQGHKVSVDPEAFRVVEGTLYLNYSKGVQQRWLKDIPGNIAAAERNWLRLRDQPRD
jgi:YHS domain-containing protein